MDRISPINKRKTHTQAKRLQYNNSHSCFQGNAVNMACMVVQKADLPMTADALVTGASQEGSLMVLL